MFISRSVKISLNEESTVFQGFKHILSSKDLDKPLKILSFRILNT